VRDSNSITQNAILGWLRVYAHCLPDASTDKLVHLLDDTHPSASQAHPDASEAGYQIATSALDCVVTQIFTSWNRMADWLRQIDGLQREA